MQGAKDDIPRQSLDMKNRIKGVKEKVEDLVISLVTKAIEDIPE